MMKKKPLVIAHRGACGYLPEHTLEGKALAFAMGPDFVELDAILTRDDRAIVFHDHYLDAMTDVAEKFPDRKRNDGWHYAVDFSLSEVKSLRLHERINPDTGTAVYPGRFPASSQVRFEIPTLEEEIELIQGLNTSMGRQVGIYLEPKGPAFHRKEGKCIEDAVINIFREFGYTGRDSRCYIQSFLPESIRYMKDTLKSDLTMVQLIGDSTWKETPGVDYYRMLTPEGLDQVAGYADLIGPWMNQIVRDAGTGREPEYTNLVELAHKRKLDVHPYTFRVDALPSYVKSFDDLLGIFFLKMGVDGIFTDFPDRASGFLKRSGLR
ncbi:MAG: glycerophosphodiester phosphodiesterase [Spirochaetes bacterium]|nr:glycerophosphodiester phosphodiesterase [Spirochaetota bacterium]